MILYFTGLGILLLIKYALNLSDYVIPGIRELRDTACDVSGRYVLNAANTVSVAFVGHILALCLAAIVGIVGQTAGRIGALIKIAAYHIQAYPIVAVAPIIFILFGDGIFSRLLIAIMICYFPLLLSFIGILSEPVEAIEHFYVMTGRMNPRLQVKIRVSENIGKLTAVISGSATLAMVGTIVAEFIAADAGIGYSIRIALYQSDLAKILIALCIIGICTSLWLFCLERIGYRIQRKAEGDD